MQKLVPIFPHVDEEWVGSVAPVVRPPFELEVRAGRVAGVFAVPLLGEGDEHIALPQTAVENPLLNQVTKPRLSLNTFPHGLLCLASIAGSAFCLRGLACTGSLLTKFLLFKVTRKISVKTSLSCPIAGTSWS